MSSGSGGEGPDVAPHEGACSDERFATVHQSVPGTRDSKTLGGLASLVVHVLATPPTMSLLPVLLLLLLLFLKTGRESVVGNRMQPRLIAFRTTRHMEVFLDTCIEGSRSSNLFLFLLIILSLRLFSNLVYALRPLP